MDGRFIDYDTDFFAWTQSQAAALRREAEAGSAAAIDWLHLAEEVADMGEDRRQEVENRFEVLTVHLLKWLFCPELLDRCRRPWRLSVLEQRRRIIKVLDKNPSLRRHAEAAFREGYGHARTVAAAEAEVPGARFPKDPPFTWEQALDPAFPAGLTPED